MHAKALLVIIPLLGITYLITIAGPTKDDNEALYFTFEHVRAFLLSIQVVLRDKFNWAMAVTPDWEFNADIALTS